ncbi:DMT family permease [Ferrimonas balearica DSM 9799]|uniref:DMT family permease n=1 Tax=Ferrimonas balearica (strain DSM 9799 / CCM 4581 / KCTC 23876 / PAT) TaxID=550540 RepID=E1ST44_FERBD|nr:DUF2955 domain-containing protein [Ferrimonas balearica]ADN76091.1 DMT family permease [Ferrimonas balearica DSM 9799]MBY5979783.1 DUF2955 domain-containing protein [Ferrimonas balearica]
MFHSRANGLIRLAVFPVLLLFLQYQFGTRLPLIAPALAAVFLSVSAVAPPVIMVVMMASVLAATAWVQAQISILLIDHPLVYYIMLFVLVYWCMQRIRDNPADLLGILMLVSTAIVAVFTQQKGAEVSQLSLSLLLEMGYAGLTAYLAYFLFPGGDPIAETPKAPPSQALHTEIWHLVVKAAVVILVLWAVIRMDLAQSTIVAITVANIIKDPNPIVGKQYGWFRVATTYGGFLFALPVLLMSLLQTNFIGQLGAALVCAMLMGIYAIKRQASFNTLQLLYTGFIVLVYYGLTETAGTALLADGKRLLSILGAVVLGMLVLIVLQPKTTTELESRT